MKASPLLAVVVLACGLGVTSAHAQVFSCKTDARDVAMKVLRNTSSSFEADLAAANAAITAAATLKADTLAGRDVPAPYSRATPYAKPALEAKSPEVAELLRRAANDVLGRSQTDIAFTRTLWAAGSLKRPSAMPSGSCPWIVAAPTRPTPLG
jgi:hypothetical protein